MSEKVSPLVGRAAELDQYATSESVRRREY